MQLAPLLLFAYANWLATLSFLIISRFSKSMIREAGAWIKPFKFALSIGVFSWSMALYTGYLHQPGAVNWYSAVTIAGLGFEIIYISLQAGRGQLSHYNTSSKLYSFLTFMMGVAAVVVTLWTGYIGLLFCSADPADLLHYYVLSIRMGIFLFVFFAFQGASMGARGSHTVGGPEAAGLPVTGWSRKHGDLRIAHFVGMHALQVLPLLSWYVLKNFLATMIVGFLYGLLAFFTLVRALSGKSLSMPIPPLKF